MVNTSDRFDKDSNVPATFRKGENLIAHGKKIFIIGVNESSKEIIESLITNYPGIS